MHICLYIKYLKTEFLSNYGYNYTKKHCTNKRANNPRSFAQFYTNTLNVLEHFVLIFQEFRADNLIIGFHFYHVNTGC